MWPEQPERLEAVDPPLERRDGCCHRAVHADQIRDARVIGQADEFEVAVECMGATGGLGDWCLAPENRQRVDPLRQRGQVGGERHVRVQTPVAPGVDEIGVDTKPDRGGHQLLRSATLRSSSPSSRACDLRENR